MNKSFTQRRKDSKENLGVSLYTFAPSREIYVMKLENSELQMVTKIISNR